MARRDGRRDRARKLRKVIWRSLTETAKSDWEADWPFQNFVSVAKGSITNTLHLARQP